MKRISQYENKWYHLFQPPPPNLPTPPFLWQKFEPHFFSKISKTHKKFPTMPVLQNWHPDKILVWSFILIKNFNQIISEQF